MGRNFVSAADLTKFNFLLQSRLCHSGNREGWIGRSELSQLSLFVLALELPAMLEKAVSKIQELLGDSPDPRRLNECIRLARITGLALDGFRVSNTLSRIEDPFFKAKGYARLMELHRDMGICDIPECQAKVRGLLGSMSSDIERGFALAAAGDFAMAREYAEKMDSPTKRAQCMTEIAKRSEDPGALQKAKTAIDQVGDHPGFGRESLYAELAIVAVDSFRHFALASGILATSKNPVCRADVILAMAEKLPYMVIGAEDEIRKIIDPSIGRPRLARLYAIIADTDPAKALEKAETFFDLEDRERVLLAVARNSNDSGVIKRVRAGIGNIDGLCQLAAITGDSRDFRRAWRLIHSIRDLLTLDHLLKFAEVAKQAIDWKKAEAA